MDKTQHDLRILIIDDNPAMYQDVKKILLKPVNSADSDESSLDGRLPGTDLFTSLEVTSALHGQEGVACIKAALKERRPYALAFIDVRMLPGWSGVETIKHIWDLDPCIQIVICTGYFDSRWENTLGQLGNKDNLLILKKPFDLVSMRQLTSTITKKWQQMQETRQHTELLQKIVKEQSDIKENTLSLMEHQATHDALTSLPNRTLLVDLMKQEIMRSKRNHTMFALFFIDLDRFKLINDSFNHKAGDELLKVISERLHKTMRPEDTIVRLSGDEFILITSLSALNIVENVTGIVAKLLHEINHVIPIGDSKITISASIGVSIYPNDGSSPEKLLLHADLAMYRAKALGGNQFQFYTPELQHKCQVRSKNETELRRALVQNEFFLEYQPQVDLDNKIIGVEALIRWQHPVHGRLLPMDFIPLAEESGLIVSIGEWVLKTACKQNKDWQDKGLPPLMMAVNMATQQFMQPNFIDMIKTVLIETGMEAKYLEIEVTENVIVNNIHVIDSIREFKKMGINIVLDDFGSGHSGLNYLQALPMTQLKIDKEFVNDKDANRSDEIIIQAIIDMAEGFDLDLIADGAENKQQLEFLKSRHCNTFQNNFFSNPISAEQLEKMIYNQR